LSEVGSGHGKHGLEYPAFSTTVPLLFPAFLCLSLTDRPIDEPAEMPELEFPGRTMAFFLNRTLSYIPAPALRPTRRIAMREKKQHLSLDMNRNFSPSLLVTMHSLNRCTKQLSHLFLRFVEFLADMTEFLSIHC
jgi:hypothetical protein